MLRELRVPMVRASAAAAAATPTLRPLRKVAAALFRHAVDAMVYGYLAMVWAHSLGGVAVEILWRWTYGEGSAAEAIGAAVRAACWLAMVRLFPAFFLLMLMRFHEHAKFEHKKQEEKEKRGKVFVLTAPKAVFLCCFEAKSMSIFERFRLSERTTV